MRRRDGGATEEDRATMRNSEISQVTMIVHLTHTASLGFIRSRGTYIFCSQALMCRICVTRALPV